MCLEDPRVRAIRFSFALVLFWPFVVAGLATRLAGGAAAANDIPLPRPRPPEMRSNPTQSAPFVLASSHAGKPVAISTEITPTLTPAQEAYASVPDADPVPAEEPLLPSACQLRLSADLAVIHPLPPIIGPGDCGALDVVRLDAIVLPDHRTVAVTPPATLRCTMAEAVVHWVREDVASAVRGLEAPLREIENYDSFECRGRNRVVGAKVSEHGLANALDVRALKLTDGKVLGPTDVQAPKELREALRQSACSRFTTVLGPGSDGNHESHIHIDLAERRNGYRICQWDVREPPQDDAETADIPLPRPRPSSAGLTASGNNGKL
jgi:hypothetical protein